MNTVIISVAVYVILLLFPIAFSLVFLRGKDGSTLEIHQSKTKDARYFAKSFVQLFDERWKTYDGSGIIKLSREEELIEADKAIAYPNVCKSVVYAQDKDFIPKTGKRFEKEIYACQNAYLFGTESVRAIYSGKNLVLGPGTQVVRWVDAEGSLTVHDDCDLGISASSAAQIIIGLRCRFRRLYAPVIFLGQDPQQPVPEGDGQRISPESISSSILRNVKYIDDDLVGSMGELESSVITKHDITVLNRLKVKGHIRSHKTIRLCDGAVVYGNLFAEGDIYIGQNARVYGNIFTQENLFVENGAVIGQLGKIKSVVARGCIIFEKGCRVYGYIGSEAGGECCPEYAEIIEEEPDAKATFHSTPGVAGIPAIVRNRVVFSTVDEFEQLAPYGLRGNEHIIEAVIPEGVRCIPSGYFYRCKRLRSVVLPGTLEVIGDFAFWSCVQLQDIPLEVCARLRYIGEAAFEGCTGLSEVTIPASCRYIGGSAFCGSGVERVLFQIPGRLTGLGSCTFKDCSSLRQVKIPGMVTSIGASAFYGCKSLEKLTIPGAVESIGSYAFFGCESLARLEIRSKRLVPQPNMLDGLPASAKISFMHAGTEKSAKGAEQQVW